MTGGELHFVVVLPPAVTADAAELQREIADLVEFVTRQNRWLMRRLGKQQIPPLYDSGLRYRRDPWGPSIQQIPNALTVLHRRFIDCKGAVPYRLAELREQYPSQHFAVHAYPRLHAGELMIHLQIRKPDGSIEDPSRYLHQ